jgi:hypothetical protein
VISQQAYEERQMSLQGSHLWRTSEGICLDGKPDLGGLNIALQLNEHNGGVPNCIFKHDCVVVLAPVLCGRELTVY